MVRLTARYHPVEDRLELTGCFYEGKSCRLWLTQRLADRLVASLVGQATPVIHSAPSSSDGMIALASQQVAQLTARLMRQPASPVEVPVTEPGKLVTAIQLKQQEDRLKLIFQHHDEALASMALSPTLLRQWLESLRHAYQVAGWPGQTWPNWMPLQR